MGSETLPHKVGPNEDVRDLSGGDCDAPNLIDCVMCVDMRLVLHRVFTG